MAIFRYGHVALASPRTFPMGGMFSIVEQSKIECRCVEIAMRDCFDFDRFHVADIVVMIDELL